MLVDTHIHLDAAEFDADRDAVVATARAAGVDQFIVPAVDRASFERVRQLSARLPGVVHHALGIHPLFVDQADPSDLDALEQCLATRQAIAVGEIGLDHFVAGHDHVRQTSFYIAQLKLARKFNLPVILHVRRAIDPILKQLRQIQVRGGIAHAFNGSRQQADIFIAMGFKLGFGGAMTFSGSGRIRRLAAELPLDAIVLETDAPDMAPAWANGARNEPVNVRRYAAELAALRGIPEDEVEDATTHNARSVFACL